MEREETGYRTGYGCGAYRGEAPTIRTRSGPGWAACFRPRVVIVMVPAAKEMPAHSFRRFHLIDGSVSQ